MKNAIPGDGVVRLRVLSVPRLRIRSARKRDGLPVPRCPTGLHAGGVLRTLGRHPPGCSSLRETPRFFFARQRPLETPAVNRDAKLFLNGLHTGVGRQARFACS